MQAEIKKVIQQPTPHSVDRLVLLPFHLLNMSSAAPM